VGIKPAEDVLDWSVIDDEIEKRLVEVTTWLRRNATFHPDPDEMGAVERAYWHFGYLSALQDMRGVLMTKGDVNVARRMASRKDQ
jgi:hypothetical protein